MAHHRERHCGRLRALGRHLAPNNNIDGQPSAEPSAATSVQPSADAGPKLFDDAQMMDFIRGAQLPSVSDVREPLSGAHPRGP